MIDASDPDIIASRAKLGTDMMKAFGGAMQTRNQNARLFSTGYEPLNKIISGDWHGGMPSGRIIEIFGPSGSGKTHISTEVAKSVQAQGGVVIFIDWERRFKHEFAERRGLNIDPPYFFYQKPRTWEEGNAKAMSIASMVRESKLFAPDAPILCIADSIAMAVPKIKLFGTGGEGDKGDKEANLEFGMNDHLALAKVISQTMPMVALLADELDVTFLYLNQTRTKPGVMFGDPTTTPGGGTFHFVADVRLQLGKSIDKDSKKNITGQTIRAKAVKAITRPFQETSWTLAFQDDGDTIFDKEASLVDLLVEDGVIATPTKGYVEFGGQRYRKDALIAAVKQDPAGYDKLVAMLPV